jgi:hypothetical protein
MSQPEEGERSHRIVEPYLREHGPSPLSEIPVSSLSRARERGVKMFLPHKGSLASQPAVGVAYLPSHPPGTVIQAWIDANEGKLADVSQSSITRRISQQYDADWVAAWRDAAKRANLKTHQTAPEEAGKDPEKVCPKCGSSIKARRFVKHLRGCE